MIEGTLPQTIYESPLKLLPKALAIPQVYVGVIAQKAQLLRPDTVTRGPDGYLRVNYERLGIKF